MRRWFHTGPHPPIKQPIWLVCSYCRDFAADTIRGLWRHADNNCQITYAELQRNPFLPSDPRYMQVMTGVSKVNRLYISETESRLNAVHLSMEDITA